MILGALVDLGVPLSRVRRELGSLPMKGWRLTSRRVTRAGLVARKVDVAVRGEHDGRGWREIRRIVAGMDQGRGRELVTALQAFADSAGEVPDRQWFLGWA